ncbi:hypothetical protein H6F68_10390 [Trichocoleus sp. FACHB-262]|nr:hypothetical protein [Trichocoleus sp. FACHB-262]
MASPWLIARGGVQRRSRSFSGRAIASKSENWTQSFDELLPPPCGLSK